ncbi:uncharacterized protein [Dysidea avara]|uniref:uncharacterized protein n=1 Tax=Dysidea avara TaxID=196820 RepID=UPI003323ABB4
MVGNPDAKKNGMFQICKIDDHYSLNLHGTPGEKQSHFRLYHAVVIHVNGQYQVTCLESVIFHGVYISWNTGSQSIEFFKGTPSVPPKNVRCIGWNQSNPESLNKDFPNCVILRAWTTPPQLGASYFLSFGGEDLPDGSTSTSPVDYIAQLTTDQAHSGAVVLTRCTGTYVISSSLKRKFENLVLQYEMYYNS